MTLKSRLFAAFVISGALAAACATSKPTESSASVEEVPHEGGQAGAQGGEQQAPAPAALEALNGDGFTVKMPAPLPAQPQQASQQLPGGAGEVRVQSWATNAEGVVYTVSIADYPEAVVARTRPEGFLRAAQNGIVGSVKGQVTKEEEITLDGYPGRAYTIASPNGEIRGRNYLVGPRLYSMLSVYNPSIPPGPRVDEFLGSLTLINPPPPLQRPGAADAGVSADGGTTMEGAGAADAGTTTAPAPRKKKKR